MPDHPNQHKNGKPVERKPGLLRYRFNADPEQLHDDLVPEYRDRLEQVLGEIWGAGTTEKTPAQIAAETLTNWHRHLLRGLEPDDRIGRFRHWKERSTYEVRLDRVDDEKDEQGYCICPGVEVPEPNDHTIWHVITRACETFREATDTLRGSQDVTKRVRPCAELFVAVLRTRPFVTNNDQIAYLTLQGGLLRMGLTPLLFVPREPVSEEGEDLDVQRAVINLDFNDAVACSLQPNYGDLEPLVTFLAVHLRIRMI
jgi:hypothetical protein